jgi:probable F420-dependent oxidoreductase
MKVRFAIAPGIDAQDLGSFAGQLHDLENLGFDTVWLSDVPLGPGLDPIVGLSYAAAATTRLKLGANIVPFGRTPISLAKDLAQLDQLSGGRLLLSFVVGIDQPGERAAMGTSGADRGALVDEVVPLLRAWWAGEAVTHRDDRYEFADAVSPGRSHQDPLEIWFGGSGPAALARVGRLGDGWLGAAVTPPESAVACKTIEAAAAEAGRFVDPEHFGLSLPYARRDVDAVSVAPRRMRGKRPPVDPADLLPVGPDRLRALVNAHVDSGVSKFVIRPLGHGADRGEELARLADVLLPLQT